MTAEFQFGEGGQPSPSKKKKTDKKTLFMIGGLAIVGFLLLKGKKTETVTYLTDGYPNGDVDTEAKMSNFNDIMNGQMNSALNNFYTEMQGQMNTLKTDIGKQTADYVQGATGAYGDQMKEWQDNNQSWQQGLNDKLNDMNQGWKDGMNDMNQDWNNKWNESNKPAPTPPPTQTPRPPANTSKGWSFATGGYSNKASAEKALTEVKKAFGDNANIVREGNTYRVVGSSSNSNAANQAIQHLKDKGMTSTGYVKPKK